MIIAGLRYNSVTSSLNGATILKSGLSKGLDQGDREQAWSNRAVLQFRCDEYALKSRFIDPAWRE